MGKHASYRRAARIEVKYYNSVDSLVSIELQNIWNYFNTHLAPIAARVDDGTTLQTVGQSEVKKSKSRASKITLAHRERRKSGSNL
jgi:hypothetical protein